MMTVPSAYNLKTSPDRCALHNYLPGLKNIASVTKRSEHKAETNGEIMAFPEPYVANSDRYTKAKFRRCGASGIDLPLISLGLWQNFGGADVFETGRQTLLRAFDRGVTHFDLANNYGPPYGSAEENFGKVLRTDFAGHRDELIISSKAGWDMWPGPYGIGGSKKYLVASLDQSLKRMKVEYVDIFYAHRPDFETPMEETAAALAQIVHQGKALYIGISSYSPERTRVMHGLLAEEGVRLFIHQPSYSMLNRYLEQGLLDTLGELQVGCIPFSPLAQGLLTHKYLNPGDMEGTRIDAEGSSFSKDFLSDKNLDRVRALNAIADKRGQSLAQMAIAWALRDARVTTALIGARNPQQLDDSLDALNNLAFSREELAEIELYAIDTPEIDLWRTVNSRDK
jgi:L-glyceraldehyde 3-phosphate reductase